MKYVKYLILATLVILFWNFFKQVFGLILFALILAVGTGKIDLVGAILSWLFGSKGNAPRDNHS